MDNGVTNIPSIPAFWALSPYSWTSRYGGEMQFNVMNTGISPDTAYMAQNCLNPFYWGMYNRSFITSPCSFSGCNNPAYQTIDPATLNAAYERGRSMMREAFLQGQIQYGFTKAGQDIATAKADIEELLANENITPEQKQKLEALKAQLTALEEKLQKLAANEEGLNLTQIQERLEAHRGELAEIQDQIKAIKDALTSTPTAPTDPSAATDPTAPTDPSAATEPTSATDPTEATEPTSATEPTAPSAEVLREAGTIAKDIYVATNGIGTDTDKLEGAIQKINADNVVELFDSWALNDYNGKTGDDSLMETIYDDVFSGSKRKEYTEHILNAFVERAEREGIDISAEQAVIEGELGCWWRNDSKIYQAFLDIHAKLSRNNLSAVA